MRSRTLIRPAWGVLLVAFFLPLSLALATAGERSQPVTDPSDDTAEPRGTARVDGLGTALDLDGLDGLRGGDGVELDLVENTSRNNGEVVDNHAENILSGSNTLSGDAFSSASGINTAIQNSGSNVLIQNATVVNVQFADPGL